MRDSKKKNLVEAASRKFDESTVDAFQERIEKLVKAGSEEVMTPRGLVWRTFPDYRKMETAWDEMKIQDEEPNPASEKYEEIGHGSKWNFMIQWNDTLPARLRKIQPPKDFPVK